MEDKVFLCVLFIHVKIVFSYQNIYTSFKLVHQLNHSPLRIPLLQPLQRPPVLVGRQQLPTRSFHLAPLLLHVYPEETTWHLGTMLQDTRRRIRYTSDLEEEVYRIL